MRHIVMAIAATLVACENDGTVEPQPAKGDMPSTPSADQPAVFSGKGSVGTTARGVEGRAYGLVGEMREVDGRPVVVFTTRRPGSRDPIPSATPAPPRGSVTRAASDRGQDPIVVDNPAPDTSRPAFQLSARPLYTIEPTRGEMYELYRLGPSAMTPDGGLIVTTGEENEIREYDARGVFRRRIGRYGAGPGEYRSPGTIVVWPTDTLVVRDGALARISVFGPDRRFVRSIRTASAVRCCTTNGFALLNSTARRPDTANTEIVFDAWSLALSTGADLLPAPGLPILRLATEGLTYFTRSANPDAGGFTNPLPLTTRPAIVFAGSTIVNSSAQRYEYHVYSTAGLLLRTVRANAPARPVTPAMVADVRRFFTTGVSDPTYARLRAEAFEAMRLPRTLPYFDRLLGEPDGSVWVRTYAPEDADQRWWTRFDPAGRMQGTMLVPSPWEVVQLAYGRGVLRSSDEATGFWTYQVYGIEPVVR